MRGWPFFLTRDFSPARQAGRRPGRGRDKRLTRRAAVLFVAVLFPALIGCPSTTSPESAPNSTGTGGSGEGERLQVVATTAMVGDVVRAVGGEHVDVTVLLGPGVDPHLHLVTRDDIARLMAADLVFYSGLMLEGKMTDSLRKLSTSKPVHAVTDAISEDQLLPGTRSDSSAQPPTSPANRSESPAGGGGLGGPDSGGDAPHADPHAWFDVRLWGQTANLVAEVLGREKPAAAEEFQEAAERFQADLAALDEYARQTLDSIPESNRVLITSHDAFGYFGRAYGVRVLGVQGISTDSEAGLRRVNELVDRIVEEDLPAVFIESSVSRKSIEALIDGARSRGHEVTIGGELYSDAAGPGGTYESTYIGMVDHNVTTIARALGGEAPAGGMSGRLGTAP